jgi:ectoine hydroxylase-related dioxygenase (phytanoyl-CoA dioxygenase family)|tara:strand:- start:347 stop:1210 length:864 start_codon:yes stop_codon:yes gene_type:complete
MMRAMAELQTRDRDTPLDELLAILDADGGVIIRDLLDEEARQAIVDDLSDAYGGTAPGSKSGSEQWEVFHGQNTIRFCGLAARSRAFVDHALLNPVFTAMTDEVLHGVGTDYWLNTSQVMAVGPGEPAQYLHRDENNWPEAINDEREVTLSCMFALSDFTFENGATAVVPGSQRLPAGVMRGHEVDPEDVAYAEMPAGAGMVYSGKVVHGAGENTSDEWRYGMHVSFVAAWLRPEEASPIAVDRETAATLPERARQLLGWSSYHSDGGGRTWLLDFEDVADLFESAG